MRVRMTKEGMERRALKERRGEKGEIAVFLRKFQP